MGLQELGTDFRWVGTEALCPPHLYPLPYGLREKASGMDHISVDHTTWLVFAEPGHPHFHRFHSGNKIVLDTLDGPEISSADLATSRIYFKCQLPREEKSWIFTGETPPEFRSRVRPFPYSTFTFPRKFPPPTPTRGIFFLGWDAKGASRRRKIVSALKSSKLPFVGGLFQREDLSPDPVPRELSHPRLFPIDLYQEMARDFKINLALAGNGPLSFRLYELLSLGCFVISERLSVPILPEEPRDREHLVFFDTTEELISLCDYYLKEDQERERIAEKGYSFYWNSLTPLQIAKYFLSCLPVDRQPPTTNNG